MKKFLCQICEPIFLPPIFALAVIELWLDQKKLNKKVVKKKQINNWQEFKDDWGKSWKIILIPFFPPMILFFISKNRIK